MKHLIIGLGNVGREYDGTRHNIGFEVVNYIAYLNNLTFVSDRYAYTCEFKFKGRSILLAKPTTYMNLSGKAVRYHLKKYNIPIENLLIIVDDKDLPLGMLRLKPKGTGGTHNGINDIVTTLNTLDFARLRIGIGNDYAKGFQSMHVLGKFTEEEKQQLRPRIELTVEIVKSFVVQGLDKTMNLYNK
jgi:PTH1 family peptidyl-tRNA hydrolase